VTWWGWWGEKRRWIEKEEGKREDELEGIFHKFALKHVIKLDTSTLKRKNRGQLKGCGAKSHSWQKIGGKSAIKLKRKKDRFTTQNNIQSYTSFHSKSYPPPILIISQVLHRHEPHK